MTTRMDFIVAEVDLPQADAGMTHPEAAVANARDECVFLQNDGGKPQHVRLYCPLGDRMSRNRIEGEWTVPVNEMMILKKDR